MAEQDTEPKKGGGLIGRLAVALFMGAVIIGECLVAYFCLPSASEVTAQAEQRATAAQAKDQPTEDQADAQPMAEVQMGTYSVVAHQISSNTTLRIDFVLVCTVLESDQPELMELFKRNEHRFRDQVLAEIRGSDVADLTDGGLGLIKRRILEKSNTLLGKPLLKSVIFSQYSFVDQ